MACLTAAIKIVHEQLSVLIPNWAIFSNVWGGRACFGKPIQNSNFLFSMDASCQSFDDLFFGPIKTISKSFLLSQVGNSKINGTPSCNRTGPCVPSELAWNQKMICSSRAFSFEFSLFIFIQQANFGLYFNENCNRAFNS